jgi:hemoglobin
MQPALIDTITEESIKQLVDTFYIKVRQDSQLKPLFERTIGANNDEWQPHFEVMYNFWSSLMLTTGKYKGNPMQKHQALPPFDEAAFDQWLTLFAETSHSIFTPEVADNFIEKSERVASSLKLALYYNPNRQIQ